jgi:hypothetical protein
LRSGYITPGQVADAAVAVDVALGELIGEAREKQFSREDWRKARDLIISKPMDHLEQVTRAAVN